MIERLALLSFRRRRLTVLVWVWVVILFGAVGASSAFSRDFADGGRLRGTDSDAAFQVIGSEFPSEPGDTVTVAYSAPGGIRQPLAVAAIDQFISVIATGGCPPGWIACCPVSMWSDRWITPVRVFPVLSAPLGCAPCRVVEWTHERNHA